MRESARRAGGSTNNGSAERTDCLPACLAVIAVRLGPCIGTTATFWNDTNKRSNQKCFPLKVTFRRKAEIARWRDAD